jgi:hypothetical protein
VTALLDQECRLERVGDGLYERDTGRIWWGHAAQHGGYVLGLAMTALDLELGGDGMSIQHVSMQYLRPFVDGPFRCQVTVERQGRTMANCLVHMWSGGKLAGLVLASMARRRPVGELVSAQMPDVAPYDPDEVPHEFGFGLPVHERVWFQPRIEEIDGVGPGVVGGWIVPRTPEIVDHRWGVLLADLWTPAIYHMWPVGHVAQTADLTYHARVELPAEELPPGSPLLVVLTTRTSQGGFVDEDAEIWSPSGRLLALGRQARFVHGA